VAPLAGRRRDVILALAAVAAVAVGHVLLARQAGEQSIQAQLNERFAERPIAAAFEKYPRLRPPLYPLVLWSARRVGIDPAGVQSLTLGATLLALALYARRFFRGTATACALVLGYAAAHWSHVNVHQRTAEGLFALALLGFTVSLWRLAGTGGGAGWVGASASALALLRYSGTYLAIPLAAAHTLLRGAPLRRRLRDLALVLALSVPPIAYWMWITHAQTGFWTGTDRARERDLPEAVRHWAELTGIDDHVRLTAKTLWIDFLSPDVPAAVNVVTLPYRPSPVEWGLFALALAAAGTALAAGSRAGWRMEESPARGMAEVAGVFLALTLAVWTVGNNDPIHTRFLFPVYPLLCLLAFHAYEAVRGWTPAWWARAPWIALYAGVVAVQALRSWRADPLPVRFLW
jgi:hypothetical protein